jgi:hypothetical protein
MSKISGEFSAEFHRNFHCGLQPHHLEGLGRLFAHLTLWSKG